MGNLDARLPDMIVELDSLVEMERNFPKTEFNYPVILQNQIQYLLRECEKMGITEIPGPFRQKIIDYSMEYLSA